MPRVTTDTVVIKARKRFFLRFEKDGLTMAEIQTVPVRYGMLYTTNSND